MKLTPYLSFDGNGREAIDYYCATLGAVEVSAATFVSMPGPPDFVNDANRDRLAHGEITLNGITIYASDTAGFEPHAGFHGVTLHLGFEDVETATDMFNRLAAEGDVRMPLTPTFWSKGFGMVADKFGVTWMVDAGEAT